MMCSMDRARHRLACRFALAISLCGALCFGCTLEHPAIESSAELLDLDSVEGSVSSRDLEFQKNRGGGLDIEIDRAASDPYLTFRKRLDSENAVKIEVAASGLPADDLYLYWVATRGCVRFSEECKLRLRRSSEDDVWSAHTSQHPRWRGDITKLRIDFSPEIRSPFTIRSIRLLPHRDSASDPNAANAEEDKLGGPRLVGTNMFNLEMREVFELTLRKKGGGIGQTPSELIVVAGDGQIRVLDLATFEVSQPGIALPPNHETDALAYAKGLEPKSFGELAAEQVEPRMRYDDILVFDGPHSRNLILSYAHFDPDKSCFTHRLSRASRPRGQSLASLEVAASDWTEVFVSQPCFDIKRGGNVYAGHQSGGRLALRDAAKGTVLLALGDYEFDGRKGVPSYPQEPGTDYGKVMEIDTRQATKSLVSLGHRNPQGILVDDEGVVWSVEHGPQGGDELNLIEVGNDYGWPQVTNGIFYGNEPWPFNREQGRHDAFTQPIFAWVPSIGVSNLDQSSGFHPLWENDLLVFALADKMFLRVRIHDRRVQFSEEVALPVDERIRYGLNHADTRSLYLWTDSGKLFRVMPAEDAWAFLEDSDAMFRQHASDHAP